MAYLGMHAAQIRGVGRRGGRSSHFNSLTPVMEILIMSNTATIETPEVSVDLVALEAKRKELQALVKASKDVAKNTEWEKKNKARNPAYVMGSLRRPTDEDRVVLDHCHGWVCKIECQHDGCETRRVINKQDAFQVRFCSEHRDEARKAASKARRDKVKLAGLTPAKVEAEIARLQAQMAAISGESDS